MDIIYKGLILISKEQMYLRKDLLKYISKELEIFLWVGKSIQKRGRVTLLPIAEKKL